MQRTFNGMFYLIKGFELLSKPGIRLFVIIPLIINILVFSLLISVAVHWFHFVTQWVDNFLPSWLHWLTWLFWLLFVLSALIVVAFTFTFLANFISSPFNGLLSEKVEHYLKGTTPKPTNFLLLLQDVPRILAREGLKLLYYVPRALLFLLLFLIPFVNVIAGVLWFLFNAWMMTLQYLDFPMDNHRIPFKHMKQQLRTHKGSTLTFGSSVLFLTLIPVVNFFVMPAAVAGATLLWIDEYEK